MIPSSQCGDILKQIHWGHLGIQKCQFRTRETVYWPGISKAIENIVNNCETCHKFSANNRKQGPDGTLGLEIPMIPWPKLTMNIFTFDNNRYLVVVDYTSKFPLIRRLPSMTAWADTEMLKSIFTEYGLPTCIVSDNGPCYTSECFATEMHKLGIQHITTSPHHHQSNGLAEVYVKITKHILQKAKDTNEDLTFPWWCIKPLPLDLTNQAQWEYSMDIRHGVIYH